MRSGQHAMLQDAYETGPRRVSTYRELYQDGATTGWHRHVRGQLLTASRGAMTVRTEDGAWLVPPGSALWIAPAVDHEVGMLGMVAMVSAYLAEPPAGLPAAGCGLLAVTPLLAAAVGALAAEPPDYAEEGRGGALAALLIDELARAQPEPGALPLPCDPRLRALCEHLLADPFDPTGLDGWAGRVGMSRRSLTRHFRAETGLSLLDWRRRARAASDPSLRRRLAWR
jgi:hypothetical protein